MLEKTNLEKVKMIARALLMTEIHETEFSPAVVQHPFTSSGITVLPRDGIVIVYRVLILKRSILCNFVFRIKKGECRNGYFPFFFNTELKQ